MSKDKGTKNIKKAPADKNLPKKKLSDYQSEIKGKSGSVTTPPKTGKSDGNA